MDIDFLKENNLILLEAVSGSKAYGLDMPESDTDIKGVFILPKKPFYSMQYVPQISNKTNDIVFYEFGRFMELLAVNNPNILELLNTPEDALIYRHPILERIDTAQIISKLCENTFGKFAISQIKKAKGLNKKTLNPISKTRKTVLDFCYVNHEQGSIPVTEFLAARNLRQEHCGLVNIPNMQDLYGLYAGASHGYKGIIQQKNADDVSLSSIPKGEIQLGLLYFNKNGYSTYCREYREYWDWVENRNEARFQNTQSHGKNYDAKNIMHTFRLLKMAIEIGKEKKINVRRPDREFLLKIKSGAFEYDTLLQMAKEKQKEMEQVFKVSDLPEKPNLTYLHEVAFEIREYLYGQMNDE